jgi:hypothetical protein
LRISTLVLRIEYVGTDIAESMGVKLHSKNWVEDIGPTAQSQQNGLLSAFAEDHGRPAFVAEATSAE